jgi:hypothetical protein
MKIDSLSDLVALAGFGIIVAAVLLLGCAGLWVIT